MTKTSKNPTKTTENAVPNRLSHALKFANELNESRLCKIRISYEKRWTKLKRTRQSARIHMQKPWAKSSGPKTPSGKAASSRNALTGDAFDRALFLPALKANEAFLCTVRLLIRLKRQNHPSTDDYHAQCLAMGMKATAGLLFALAIADISENLDKRIVSI